MASIYTKNITISKDNIFNIDCILQKKFGTVVRWAIVGASDNNFILSVSYKSK